MSNNNPKNTLAYKQYVLDNVAEISGGFFDWVEIALSRGVKYVSNNISSNNLITDWEGLCTVKDEEGDNVFGYLIRNIQFIFDNGPSYRNSGVLLWLKDIAKYHTLCVNAGKLPERPDIYIKDSKYSKPSKYWWMISNSVLTVTKTDFLGVDSQIQYNIDTETIEYDGINHNPIFCMIYTDDKVAECIKSPTNSTVGHVIAVKAVDENGKPTEYEAADIATLTDKYEWHKIKLYYGYAHIANDPDYSASITDWDGLVEVPDPEYPDMQSAISSILGNIGSIFSQGPSDMNPYSISTCNSVANSYLAIREAGIFTDTVYFAVKSGNNAVKYSLMYRSDNNVLTIMIDLPYRESGQIMYDIGAKQIISESIDHNFTYTKMYVDATKIPIPETATVGQTIVVKAVDENGKPTEWECVDIASGSGSGLPAVTEADNGKILTVVDGVWTAIALPNAEEASF